MISFSQEVKNELSNLEITVNENILAELSGIILLSSELTNKQGKSFIKVKLTNNKVARRFYFLIKKIIPDINIEISLKKTNLEERNFEIWILNKDKIIEKTLDIDFFFSDNFPSYLKTSESKLSFIRGVFLARGSISDPHKGYNVSLIAYDNEFSDELIFLLSEFDFNFKKLKRKSSYNIYMKGGEKIGEFLRYIGAMQTMFEFENIRILRDAKNYATRTSNFDNANIEKIIKKSEVVIQNIKIIKNNKKFKNLKDKEKMVANLKINNPEQSMSQMVETLNSKNIKISKTTISNIFKKIEKLANEDN